MCRWLSLLQVAELLARLAVYANSTDQIPPSIFYPFNRSETGANGLPSIAPWNYQCPQCARSGAQPGPHGNHYDPWCDDVECGVGPPAPPATQRAAPA